MEKAKNNIFSIVYLQGVEMISYSVQKVDSLSEYKQQAILVHLLILFWQWQ